MSIHLSPRARDVAIRATGIVCWSAGALALAGLYRAIHAGPSHATTCIECGVAALGFIGLSLGSSLLALGSHIFDQVEVSARWASRYGPDQRQVREHSDGAFARSHDADRTTDKPKRT
ncbi:hypothetical protein MZO42_16315 [Sphingomonas psychrotolerans]|uniref:Uncharacterized protein n=1 Tax=Sphingomonas psychrotolerans TaxID=1327635 RepID=A0ABU3N7I3_9SPHN|nr:hypothetical protein [Sphingomonas psychrotolerans]MDT8760266.1 hypothetical protein [Sphingomonas psychrotolerans]